jgi:outer membrane protein TolC
MPISRHWLAFAVSSSLFWVTATRAEAADAGAPVPPASAATEHSAPELPVQTDAMLKLPDPPPHVLANWQDAIRLLRQNSTALRSARAQISQAQAQVEVTRSPALPQIKATGTVFDHLLRGQSAFPPTIEVPRPGAGWNAALGVTVPVIAPRTWFDTATAHDNVTSVSLGVKDVERQQVAQLAGAIVDVVTKERLAEVSRVSLASTLSTLDLTRRRAALGAANRVDVLRIEQEVSDSRAVVIQSDEDLQRAREALGQLLGSSDAWGVTPEIQLDALAADAETSCAREAGIDLRSDVRAAGASVHVAKRNVESVSYAFVPTLDATSTLTYWSSHYSAPDNRSVSWVIGGLLTFQIYDGGLRYGTRSARKADLTIAEQHLADVRRQALVQVTQAVRGVRVAESNRAVSEKSRDIAVETARLTQIAYMSGTGTSLDLVVASQRLRQAELDFAIKEFQVLQAKIAALLALATCKI